MTEEIKERKPRRAKNPIEVYSDNGDGTLTRLDMPVPQGFKSSDALVRWLKSEAQVSGTYVLLRRLVTADIEPKQVPAVEVTVR